MESNISYSYTAAADIAHSQFIMSDSRVSDNFGTMGGLSCGWSQGHISNSLFERNWTDSTFLHFPAHLELVEFSGMLDSCTFRDNIGGHKSVYVSDSRWLQIIGNTFIDNSAAIDYGILYIERFSGEVAYNLLENNVTGYGGALVSNSSMNAQIHHNIFRGNSVIEVGNYGSAIQIQGVGPIIENNLFDGNVGATIALTGALPFYVWNNWWGDASGPYHPTLNPTGQGDTLLQPNADFIPWLSEPPDTTESVGRAGNVFVPVQWHLDSIYPNPFNSHLRIAISGRPGEDFRLTLHNLLGEQVAVIHRGLVLSDELIFTAPPALAAGLYFIHAQSRTVSQTQKVIFLK